MKPEPHIIHIDFKRDTQYNVPTVPQGDTATYLLLRVTDGGKSEPELLDDFTTITLTSEREDGKTFYVTGERQPGTNDILVHLGTSETDIPGNVWATVQFYSENGRNTSSLFRYEVDRDLTGVYEPSEREGSLIELVLTRGPEILAEAERKIDEMEEATDATRTATTNADTATANANTARDAANTAASRADTATSNANTARNAANTATTNANAARDAANTAATKADTARTNANTATTQANAARDAANTAATAATAAADNANDEAANLSGLKNDTTAATSAANTAAGQAEAAATSATNAASAANTAAGQANTAATNANGAASTANTAAGNANTATERANTAADAVDDAIEGAEAIAANTTHRGAYSASVGYERNNVVTYAGSSYMATRETTGNVPTNTTYWQLLAQKGLDGSGSVSSVNNIGPDATGNVSTIHIGATAPQNVQSIWIDTSN